MKSIKLSLAVLMLAAVFTACTKEEMVPTQDAQNGEYVGAKLIGSNLSMDFVREGETKLDASGWAQGDEAGLGWVVSGNYNSVQTENLAPSNKNPFANHLFKNVEGNSFTTYGNVYEGWHFAYYPYQYMKQVGVPMEVDINPDMKDFYDKEQWKTRLLLSARQFLTEDNLTDDRCLDPVETHLELQRAVKTIKVYVKPDATLASEALNTLSIKELELSTSHATAKPFFSGKVALNLEKLAAIVKDPGTEAYNVTDTKEAYFASLANVWSAAVGDNTIVTKVKKSGIDLSEEQVLRIYTLPYTTKGAKNDHVTLANTKFVVRVDAGYFTIQYKDPKSTDYVASIHGVNNAALEKLVEAYKSDGETVGYLRGWEGEKEREKLTMSLKLVLSADLFEADFSNICSEAEWNSAVKMVDALGLEEATFNIAKTRSTTPVNWKFVDEDGDGNLINLPAEAELTVTCLDENGNDSDVDIILDAEGSWPTSENFIVETDVQIRKDLQVEGVLNVKQGNIIYNGATITAGDEAEIGTRLQDKYGTSLGVDATFINYLPSNSSKYGTYGKSSTQDGTVMIEYGSYVYPKSGCERTIAYKVNNTSVSEIRNINRLLGQANDYGSANVNTLIVETILDINARAVEGLTGDDRYEEILTPEQTLMNLKEKLITVKLQGGALVHNLSGNNTTVHEVIAVSGDNTINDVIADNIEVKTGATLNVNNTRTSIAKTYFSVGSITNYGTLNVNNARLDFNEDVTNAANASINITGGSINYHGDYTQDGKVSGSINKGYSAKIVASTVKEFKEAITKAQATTDINTVELAADVVLDATEVNVDGLVLNGNGYTITTSNKVVEGDNKSVFTINSGTIKNVTFAAPNTNFDVKVNGTANVTISDCNFTTATATAMNKGKRAVYIGNYSGKLTVKNCTFDDKVYAFNVYGNAKNADVYFEKCNLNGWMSGAAKFSFKECTFGKSGDFADFIPYAHGQVDADSNPIPDAYFDKCNFASMFEISLKNASFLKFNNNCTFGGKAIAAPQDINWSWDGGETPGDSNINQQTVKVSIKYNTTWNSWTTNATTTDPDNFNESTLVW